MTTLTPEQLLRVLHEDTYYAIPHSINAWLNSFKLKHSTKLVAQTLISQAIIRSRNKNRLLTRISKSLLSKLSGVGIRTIPSCIKELSKHGIIAVLDTTSIGTLYEILIDAQCIRLVRPRKNSRPSRLGTSATGDRPRSGHTFSIPATNLLGKQVDNPFQIGTDRKPMVDRSSTNTVYATTPQRRKEESYIQQAQSADMSQVGTFTTKEEEQVHQDIDRKAKALGFDSKEKMFLALSLYRLGKRNIDPDTVERMILLEKTMMRHAREVEGISATMEKGKREASGVSQVGTGKHIANARNDEKRTEKESVPNRDSKAIKAVQAGIKLRKSQIRGIMTRMRKLSDRIPLWREIALEIVWAIEKGHIGKEGMTTFHRINAAVKLVRDNRWRTPAGYKPMEVGHAILA